MFGDNGKNQSDYIHRSAKSLYVNTTLYNTIVRKTSP